VAAASEILRRVFTTLGTPITFQFWDGSAMSVGPPEPSRCTVVLHSRRIARRLLRHPTPLRFAEAFIAGDIDIEGDLLAAASVGARLDRLAWPLRTRLRLLPVLLRV